MAILCLDENRLDANGQAGIELAEQGRQVNSSLGKGVDWISGEAEGSVRHRNFIGVYCGIKGAGGQIGRCINIVKTAGLAASHRPPGHTETCGRTPMREAECQNEVVCSPPTIGSVRIETAGCICGVVRNTELILQKLEINIGSSIVALPIPRDHRPGVAVGILGDMKQGVINVLLVTHWIERPVPCLGVIVHFIPSSEVVIGGAPVRVEKMEGGIGVHRSTVGVQHKSAAAGD